ncbi:MAG: C10 family peptidase [Kiritimatiellae bacterium]|nr:C10 family peptidase [Kiritimatiellia bacterium]
MLYAAVLSASLALDGAPVAEDAVQSAAEGFLRRSSAAQRILPGRTVSSLAARGNLWIVSLSPSGHVVFAGSDKCSPVVSFSPDDFTEPEAGSALYAQLQNTGDWVAGKEADESAAVDSGWAKYTATDTKKRLLSAAPSGATVGDGYDDFVNPFLGTTWSQGAPMTDLTPLSSPCGCAATAGGQEFRHWRWPYRFEKSRSFTHALRDSYNNALNYTMRPDGRVPIDWDKVAAAGTSSTPWETDKTVGYNTAFLTMWMQTMVNMGFKAGGSYATRKLCSDAENYWYEAGKVMSQGRDGYDNLWCAITNDLKFGSPIQINTPVHQMVIDGYAIENAGTDSEIDYVNTNYGWGNGIRWENLKTAIESGGGAGKFADFQVGFRPQKIVQFEPLAKVSTSDVTLKWHIAPCYTNRTTGFTVQIAKTGGETATETVATHDETTVWTASGLDDGGEYTFTVTPVMADGSEARTNSVATVIGAPQPAPEIVGVSSVACGIDLVQQGFYIECARAITNYIAVTCSETTTALEAYSSHLTILPDEKISVSKSGSVFTIAVDATDMAATWNGEMLLLTLVAKNSDGTEAYKNLMLRFNGMRQVLGGTFEMVETNPTTPVWFCGSVVLDAKGQAITFGANAFQGNGCDVTLTDSVGGGSFTFESLDGFLGTLHITSAATVNLPSDMSNFSGTLAYDRCTTDLAFHYTLSRNLPSTATVYLPQYTLLYLDNVTVDAAFTGKGAVYITSGSSTLSNTSGFSGTVELGDYTNAGTLTLNAGEEPSITIWNGTLYLTLSRAQVAYGYSTSQIKYNWGTVVFQDEDGNELKRWTTDDKTFAVDPSANTWTPDAETGTGRFNDAARWSRGSVPSAGELVIFNDNFGDTEMTLDLSADFNLAHVKVIGTRFTIKSSGTGKLSVDTFENTVPTKLATTNIVPATVVPRGKLFVQTGLTISCDIDSSLAQNLRDISDAMSALIWDDGDDYCIWRGTVVFKDYSAAYLNLNEWGHSRSSVRFNGVTGHISSGKTYDVPVELADNGSTVALNWNNGSSGATTTFAKIYGAGTFKTTAGGGNNENVLVKDASEFTGSFQLAAKNVIFGNAAPSSDLGSNGRLHILTNATVAAGAIWNIGGGVYLGSGCNLTVRGQLLSTGTTASIKTCAEDTQITFEDGSLLRTAVALSGDYSPDISFKAATWQATQNRTETKTVNFCADSGSYTTLDAYGNTVTLGADFFSGSGDVYLTSSTDGGAFIIQGIPSAYTGTTTADITARVTITGDMSASSAMLNLSGQEVSVSSDNLGNIVVGDGATLSVTLTDRQAMKGYAASSVTLAGGTIEFVDAYGTALGTSTESTTYVKPEGYSIAPVPTAVWVSGEFADEPELHGGYSISTTLAGSVNSSGNIVIGSDSSIGATLNLSTVTNTTKASVLVKFKSSTPGAPAANAAIMGVISTDGNPVSPICTTADGTSFTGAYLNSGNNYALVTGYPFSTTPEFPAGGEGYMLFCYQSDQGNSTETGTAFYIGDAIETMAGGAKAGLQWRQKKLTSFYIGGPASTTIPTWAGLEIEAVALFVDEWYSPSNIEFYEFPTVEEPEEPYEGPAPTAVWVAGEFEDHKSAHAGCEIALNGNTVNERGQIVIGNDTTLGATISVPNYDQATMLVKYSIPSGGAPAANAVPAVAFVNYDLGPVATASGSSNLTGYYYNNGVIANYPFATTPSLPQSGYLLISVPANSNGAAASHYAAVYAGSTTSSLIGGEAASLRFTGPNNRVTKVGIGGPTKAGAVPWAGMVIEGVALFDSWVTPDDIAGYTFPEKGAVQPVDDDEYLVEPAAVWVNDFKTAEKGGYTLSTSGTTAVRDDSFGGDITIGDAAAAIAIPEPTRQWTMLVKYAAAPAQSAQNFFACGSFTNKTTTVDLGVLSESASSTALVAGYDNGSAKTTALGTTITPSTTGGYLLIAHDAGSKFYVYAGETYEELYNTSATIDYVFTDWWYTSLAVGGPSGKRASNKCGAWEGLVVEKIAIFDGCYTVNQIVPIENPEDAATLSIADNATWNFAAGTTRTYESIGTLSSGGTIAVTNDTIAAGVYKLAEWTTPQVKSTGYGRVGTLNVPNLPSNFTAELVYGATAIYLRVYDATAQAAKPMLKVWPYGDSITEGFNASNTKANYRVLLAQKLTLLGYNVEMVGCYDRIQTATEANLAFMDAIDPSGAAVPDRWKWHSAKHGGTIGVTTATNYKRSAMVENVDTLAVQAGNPDIILLHAGINDLYASGQTPASVFANLTNTVSRLVADLPDAKIVISTCLYGDAANSQRKTYNSSVVEPFNTLVRAFMESADFPVAWQGRVYLADLNTYVQTYRDDAAPAGITVDNLHPDWLGHDQMAEGWLSVITNVYPSASGTFPSSTPLPQVAAADLGAAAKTELADYIDGFELAQTIAVASTNAPAVVDGSGLAEGIGKVGYFVECVRADNEAHKWVWVDMDAFATTLADLGLPAANRQHVVTALHVKSNHNGIDDIAADDDTVSGWIEFSPYDYTGAASGVADAPAAHGGGAMFDWNDTLGSSGTMGSMQVFRIAPPSGRPAQVLFAYNNWQSSSTAAEFGIGNFAQHFWGGAQTLDYTNTKDLEKMNAAAYRVKRIEIWTKRSEPRTVYYKSGYWGTGGDTSLVVTLADGTETTLREGDTIVIDDKSSGGVYFGYLPDHANKIRVSRDVVFSSGIDNAAILGGATIEIDEGKTVTFKRQYHDIALGAFAITGEGAIAFDVNDGSITLDPAATVNGVTVRPELDSSVAAPYDAAKEEISIKAISGLWYSVIYGDRLVSGGIGGETGETEPVKAPSTGPLTLGAPKDGAKRFYRVKVSPRDN